MTDIAADPGWSLTLHVSGASAQSIQAIETVRRVWDEEPARQGDSEVVDVQLQPSLAVPARSPPRNGAQAPSGARCGDLSDTNRVRLGLDGPPGGTATNGSSL